MSNPLDGARSLIRRLRDGEAKHRLEGELAALGDDRGPGRFHLVVFGTGAAGKTSLVNALLGRPAGETAPVMGTTRHGAPHTETLEGPEGTVLLTDTPGLSVAGAEGLWDEAEALELAARADLLLFVLEGDLQRREHEALALFVRHGKRAVVVLNKKDRLPAPELAEVHAKLRERLAGLVPPEDVVAVAAAPRPVPVRVRVADGSERTVLEYEEPDLSALEERIAAILAREGDALRAGNLLLRAYLLRREAQEALARQRRAEAEAVIDRHQWLAAKAVFALPIPEAELVAAGAVEYRMIAEIAAVFGADLSLDHVRMIGAQMVQTLIRRRVVEAATSLVAGLLRSSLVGFAVGGAVQGVTAAYLTHVTGQAFLGYFERGQQWGEGGMQAALARELEAAKRAEFLREFARQAVDELTRRLGRARGPGDPAADRNRPLPPRDGT